VGVIPTGAVLQATGGISDTQLADCDASEVPRPAGENAGRRDDAIKLKS